MKETSKAVRASRQKTGVKATSIYMTDAQREALDAFKERIGAGGRAEAIMEAIGAYDRNDLSREQVIDWITRNTKE